MNDHKYTKNKAANCKSSQGQDARKLGIPPSSSPPTASSSGRGEVGPSPAAVPYFNIATIGTLCTNGPLENPVVPAQAHDSVMMGENIQHSDQLGSSVQRMQQVQPTLTLSSTTNDILLAPPPHQPAGASAASTFPGNNSSNNNIATTNPDQLANIREQYS